MNDDQVFRFILIAGFLVIVPVGLYHRVKSQATGEKLDRRQEGIFILVSLRLLGLAGWIGLLIYMIDPSWIAWSSVLSGSRPGIGCSVAGPLRPRLTFSEIRILKANPLENRGKTRHSGDSSGPLNSVNPSVGFPD